MRSPSLAITNMIQLESNESQPISLENVEITKITDGDFNVSSCHLVVIWPKTIVLQKSPITNTENVAV